jgi:predicted membrane-bound spermidine synthase
MRNGAERAANARSRASAALGGARLAVVGVIFAASGGAALIYQVSWQRILALHSGIGVYSVAVIVAAFLAGLGAGSYAGARMSRRLGSRGALRAFALLELGIAALSAASPVVYYDLLYLRWPELFGAAWSAAPVHFALLLPPTLLMGMSLPFLTRAAVSDAASAPRVVGYLYGINVVGAAIGAMLSPWFLLRLYGVRGAILVGVTLNALSGVVALAIGASRSRPESFSARHAPPVSGGRFPEPAGSRPLALWFALYGLSGFVALSLEILWFRVIDVAVKSTAFTFGTVLAVYLIGLGAGSLAGAPLAVSVARPLRAFLVCQGLLLLWAGAALGAVVWLPVGFPGFDGLFSFWSQYEEFPLGRGGDWPFGAQLYLAIPLALYGIPTFLMGVSFAVLQRAVQDDATTSGFKVGVLQAGNIAGNVAGSLITGLLLLNVVGTPGTMRVLLALGLLFPALGIREYGFRSVFPALAGAMVVLALVIPSHTAFWSRLHGLESGPALFAEDATGLAAVTPQSDGKLRLSINGKGQSWFPFGGLHSLLGAIPAAIHPAPRDVAMVGLGSGDSAWAVAFREETESVTVFEINAGQPALLRGVADSAPWPTLVHLLDDPRIDVVVADGRIAIAASDARYDIIEADALRPGSAYAGNLYSLEFFELCAARLKPGGLMCTWAPTPRVYVTFCEVFPHVLVTGEILVGSNDPIPRDLTSWLERAGSEAALEYLGSEVATSLEKALSDATGAEPELLRDVGWNRDLFPRDEFSSP